MKMAHHLQYGFICLTLGMITFSSQIAAQHAACPRLDPVKRMDGVNFYVDDRGSIVDPALERRNMESLRNVMEYLHVLSSAVDEADSTSAVDVSCAAHLMQVWAKADALLERPIKAQVARVFASVSLNILARKLTLAGAPAAPGVVSWLRSVTSAVMKDYNRETLKNTIYYRNNVYFWSGVAAGSFALVERDPRMVAFLDQAWKDALDTVRDDGFLGAELARGRRAMVYHLSSFSALLLMRDMRRALHLPTTLDEQERLSRLSNAIGQALCDDTAMSKESGTQLEKPGDWGFRVTSVFGDDVLSADWQRCGISPKSLTNVRIGGDLRRTRDAIEALGRR